MCVAIFKPKDIEIPNKETLYNCFLKNRDGAGYSIYRNGKILLHKGFMTFDDFYTSFMNEKPLKTEPIFIHFRIATHGLVDGGNTHPFPVVQNFDTMRKTLLNYQGKCLIHNGIFHYTEEYMTRFDKAHKISDTMLFSRILSEQIKNIENNNVINNLQELGLEESIAMELVKKNQTKILNDNINKKIAYSKLAIMNEDGTVEKYGNWIEHDGCFYSNNSFETYKPIVSYHYSNYNNNYYQSYLFADKYVEYKKQKKSENYLFGSKAICDFCGEYKKNCIRSDEQMICLDCLNDYDLGYCLVCKTAYDKSEMDSEHICSYCYREGSREEDIYSEIEDFEEDDNENLICVCCGQNYLKKDESVEPEICNKCYKKFH